MGNLWIEDFKGRISEEGRLKIHLQNNHYPPVHSAFIPACKEAIEACQPWNSDYDKQIKLCNGKVKSAAEIVKGLHLHSFITEDEE